MAKPVFWKYLEDNEIRFRLEKTSEKSLFQVFMGILYDLFWTKRKDYLFITRTSVLIVLRNKAHSYYEIIESSHIHFNAISHVLTVQNTLGEKKIPLKRLYLTYEEIQSLKVVVSKINT